MFAALPLLWRLAIIAGLLAGLLGTAGGLYAYVRQQGYDEGYRDRDTICVTERRAMEEANRKAISEAEKKLLETERELIEKETKLDDLLKALDLAADTGADSSDICLSVERVRRLSQF